MMDITAKSKLTLNEDGIGNVFQRYSLWAKDPRPFWGLGFFAHFTTFNLSPFAAVFSLSA